MDASMISLPRSVNIPALYIGNVGCTFRSDTAGCPAKGGEKFFHLSNLFSAIIVDISL